MPSTHILSYSLNFLLARFITKCNSLCMKPILPSQKSTLQSSAYPSQALECTHQRSTDHSSAKEHRDSRVRFTGILSKQGIWPTPDWVLWEPLQITAVITGWEKWFLPIHPHSTTRQLPKLHPELGNVTFFILQLPESPSDCRWFLKLWSYQRTPICQVELR